jgi:hypothetical protein
MKETTLMKRILAGGAALFALAVPLSACDGTTDSTPDARATPTAPSVSPSPKPAERLAKAVAATDGQNLSYTLVVKGETATVSYDTATKGTSMVSGTGARQFEVRLFPGTFFLQNPLKPGAFFRIDVSKLNVDSEFRALEDPFFARQFLSTATTVTSDASGAVSGTIDLTRVTGTARTAADYFARTAGDRTTALPFTATMDGQGRLATFTATFPGADDGKDLVWDLKVVEIGGTVSVQQPAGTTVTPLPASEYKDL